MNGSPFLVILIPFSIIVVVVLSFLFSSLLFRRHAVSFSIGSGLLASVLAAVVLFLPPIIQHLVFVGQLALVFLKLVDLVVLLSIPIACVTIFFGSDRVLLPRTYILTCMQALVYIRMVLEITTASTENKDLTALVKLAIITSCLAMLSLLARSSAISSAVAIQIGFISIMEVACIGVTRISRGIEEQISSFILTFVLFIIRVRYLHAVWTQHAG